MLLLNGPKCFVPISLHIVGKCQYHNRNEMMLLGWTTDGDKCAGRAGMFWMSSGKETEFVIEPEITLELMMAANYLHT
jgi:hypothetical protein